MKRICRTFPALAVPLLLNGCGTYVPSLQEFPAKPGDEQLLVQAIITSIHCDIAGAVNRFIDKDIRLAKLNGGRQAAWIDNWGAQLALTLVVDEKTTISPTVVGMPPSPASAIFAITGTATATSDAIRTSKSNFFFTVADLRRRGICQTGVQPVEGAPSPLIQNNLKIADWLFDQIAPGATREVSFPASASGVFKQNVLSQEIKFDIFTSGGINPAFTLTRATINGSGTFLSASRDRTSDLIVTFGPLDPKQNNNGLALEAENVHLTQQIGLANATNGRNMISIP